MKTLEITKEIYQNWIDAEKQMAIYDGDDHPAVISHNEIGKTIFGDNLKQVKTWIYDNCDKTITIEDLKLFEKNTVEFYKYKVELFEYRKITSFDCFRLKNFTATYVTKTDYYTLDGYTKLVVFKNKHVLALIKNTISKEEIQF